MISDYRAHSGIGGTDVREMLADFERWRYMRELRAKDPEHWLIDDTPTPAMQLGTLIHMGLLQPWLYDAQGIVMDYTRSFATIEGKNIKKKAQARATEIEGFLIRHEHDHIIKELRPNWISALGNLKVPYVLDPNVVEVELYGTHEGVPCKGMADLLIDGEILIDLKTISQWQRRKDVIETNFYHAQLAHYAALCTLPPRRVAVIFAETEPPYRVEAVEIPIEQHARGMVARNAVIERLANKKSKGPF